jgi:DNA-directed RNA polymerase specialized sigma24 family protein
VVEAIGVLPPNYRAVFVLHDIEGAANTEIAEALGMSLLAVTSRVHRSRLIRTEAPVGAPRGYLMKGKRRSES